MVEQTQSKFWLDMAVSEIIAHYPKGEIVVSSGISPSASYHIGHFREILTADALTWGIRQAGRKARHIHVVDNFDPLRKRYDFLPEWIEEYVGQPICLIPAPDKSSQSYADYFFNEFEQYVHQMGIYPDEVVKSYEDLYKSGKMASCFEAVLTNIDKVHKIFAEVSNRQVEPGWTPIQVLGEDNKFFNAELAAWDKDQQTIGGQSYRDGHAKLNWRLDWPARWSVLGVMVEPHGRELASAGSAYQTGLLFSKEIFASVAPIAGAQYQPVHLPGDPRKMSSSLGNFVTPKEALEIMPPEVLRYFVVRSRPDKPLHFDSGEGLYNLIDEFSKVKSLTANNEAAEFREAYLFASDIPEGEDTISVVPFKHLVYVYQAALGNFDKIKDILIRTGYKEAVQTQADILKREVNFVKNWLIKYAPDEAKFELAENLNPKLIAQIAKLDPKAKDFLGKLADKLQPNMQGDEIHNLIYEAKEAAGVKAPAAAFAAIYLAILGKNLGPKAGWFLSILDYDWLIKRLRLEA